MESRKIGLEHEPEWIDKIWKIRNFTQLNEFDAHDALMQHEGDVERCIGQVIGGNYVPINVDVQINKIEPPQMNQI